ncbi:hypothetical protein NQZ68_030701, partial [Dissostichus eleginoides]
MTCAGLGPDGMNGVELAAGAKHTPLAPGHKRCSKSPQSGEEGGRRESAALSRLIRRAMIGDATGQTAPSVTGVVKRSLRCVVGRDPSQ